MEFNTDCPKCGAHVLHYETESFCSKCPYISDTQGDNMKHPGAPDPWIEDEMYPDNNTPYPRHEFNQDYPNLVNTQEQIKNGEFFNIKKFKPQDLDCDGAESRDKNFTSAPTTEKIKIKTMSEIYSEGYYDNVRKPEHYKIFPDAEVIDLIRKCLTKEEFIGYCKGNILKYRLRDKHDNTEDFAKSKQYKEYLNDDSLQRSKKS